MKGKNVHYGQRNTYMAIVTGVVFGLSLAFFDMTVSMLSTPARYGSFFYMLGPIAITAVAGVVCYVGIWFLIASRLARYFRIRVAPFAISLAFFLGIVFMLTSMFGFHIVRNSIFTALMILTISFGLSIGSYFTVVALDDGSKVMWTLRILALALPLLLAETMIVIWMRVYRVNTFGSMVSVVVTSAYLLVVLITVGLFFWIGRNVVRERLLFALALVVVLSPLIGVATLRPVDHAESDLRNEDNPIKRVVLITVDTLRRDGISCYSRETTSTPNIDQLAENGVLFTRAMSPAPWTLPSVASIMTGVAPSVHLVLHRDSKLPKSLPTLAEHMREAGYLTSGIGNNDFLGPDHDFDRGFREYDWYKKAPLGNSYGEVILQRLFPNRYKIETSAGELTEAAVAWLIANADESFFLWIHYLAPHEPYTPPEKYCPKMKQPPGVTPGCMISKARAVYDEVQSAAQRLWFRELYKGEVFDVDDGIGRLVDTLRDLGLYDESLIVFTSDHGEEFWEHNAYSHGHTLYDELIRVPLIVKPPFSPGPRKVKTTVTTQSIMPTVLELCGVEFEKDYLAVESLAPLWGQDPDSFGEKPVFSTGTNWALKMELEAVVFDGFKYIRSRMTGREDLYDLNNDNNENHSIASHSPTYVEMGRLLLAEHNDRADELRRRFDIRIERAEENEEILQRLKALGYL